MTLAAADAPELRSYGSVLVAALLVTLGMVGVIGGWAMFARLDAAVVSYGVLHADSERKSVEHLEGGILSELLVRAGDRVDEGQVVARLDATQTRELLAQLRTELSAARFAIWRLTAEEAGVAPDLCRRARRRRAPIRRFRRRGSRRNSRSMTRGSGPIPARSPRSAARSTSSAPKSPRARRAATPPTASWCCGRRSAARRPSSSPAMRRRGSGCSSSTGPSR